MAIEWSVFTQNPLFGFLLGTASFCFGQWLYQKTKNPICNPLMVASACVIMFLLVFNIPVAHFNEGGAIFELFMIPATACLGLTIYRVLPYFKKYWLPIVVGCVVGCITVLSTTLLLCEIFGLSDQITQTLFPKSVTTPIAMSISATRGGNPNLTSAAVTVVGVFGGIFAPVILNAFRITDPVAQGVAIGTSSHAVGTARALLLGEVQGAMSGVAMALAAVVTVFLSMVM